MNNITKFINKELHKHIKYILVICVLFYLFNNIISINRDNFDILLEQTQQFNRLINYNIFTSNKSNIDLTLNNTNIYTETYNKVRPTGKPLHGIQENQTIGKINIKYYMDITKNTSDNILKELNKSDVVVIIKDGDINIDYTSNKYKTYTDSSHNDLYNNKYKIYTTTTTAPSTLTYNDLYKNNLKKNIGHFLLKYKGYIPGKSLPNGGVITPIVNKINGKITDSKPREYSNLVFNIVVALGQVVNGKGPIKREESIKYKGSLIIDEHLEMNQLKRYTGSTSTLIPMEIYNISKPSYEMKYYLLNGDIREYNNEIYIFGDRTYKKAKVQTGKSTSLTFKPEHPSDKTKPYDFEIIKFL